MTEEGEVKEIDLESSPEEDVDSGSPSTASSRSSDAFWFTPPQESQEDAIELLIRAGQIDLDHENMEEMAMEDMKSVIKIIMERGLRVRSTRKQRKKDSDINRKPYLERMEFNRKLEIIPRPNTGNVTDM